MSTRHVHYRSTPFAQMLFLVSEALRGPHAASRHAPDQPAAPRMTWLERLDAWLWRVRQREREAWLAQAKDIAEVETRLRALERGVRPYY
jgi:hypothetical protein